MHDLLEDARARLERLDPERAHAAALAGAKLLDIRTEAQRQCDGEIPGALCISRNVLEWRLDPASEHRHPQGPDLDDWIIVVCEEGYQSSLVAATLQQLGFSRATDLVGGFRAWRAAGLPVQCHPAEAAPGVYKPVQPAPTEETHDDQLRSGADGRRG